MEILMFSGLSYLMPRSLYLLIVIGLSLSLAACATTRQTRGVETAGFLGDYSQLRKGEGEEAQLVYINPTATWSKYNAILLDSVTLWQSDKTAKISDEDAQRLTDYLYAQLHKQLSQDYRIVTEPGPGVMRLRAAVTEAKGANVVGNAATTIVPQLRLITTVGGMATDAAVFAGEAAAEVELTDSLTGVRLGAAVDERVGAKTLRGGLGKWSQVERAFEYWAERLKNRLAALRKS
jgi:hypothetical protein